VCVRTRVPWSHNIISKTYHGTYVRTYTCTRTNITLSQKQKTTQLEIQATGTLCHSGRCQHTCVPLVHVYVPWHTCTIWYLTIPFYWYGSACISSRDNVIHVPFLVRTSLVPWYTCTYKYNIITLSQKQLVLEYVRTYSSTYHGTYSTTIHGTRVPWYHW
jgi:hypothetical protein